MPDRLHWNFYLCKRVVLVPTLARTEAGYLLEIEPVERASVDDAPDIVDAILAVMKRGNPIVPTPTRANFPKPVLPPHAGVRSWAAFSRAASSWGISFEDGRYSITPDVLDSKWGFREDPERKELLPPGISVLDVARHAAQLARIQD